MDRRDFLQGLSSASALAVVAATAGCGGSDTAPTDTPQQTPNDSPEDSTDDGRSTATTDTPLATAVVAKAFDFETAEDGHLIVTVPIENRASDKRTRTVVVTVEADGETYEQSVEVTLESGAAQTLDVDFPAVDMDSTGSIDAGISIEE